MGYGARGTGSIGAGGLVAHLARWGCWATGLVVLLFLVLLGRAVLGDSAVAQEIRFAGSGEYPADSLRDSLVVQLMAGAHYVAAARRIDSLLQLSDSSSGAGRSALLLDRAACLVYTQRDLPRAIRLLAGQPASPRVLLLQARAYQLLYRFDEAYRCYDDYLSGGDLRLMPTALAQQARAACQSAKALLSNAHAPVCYARKMVPANGVPSALDSLAMGYRLVPLPRVLWGRYEQQPDSTLASLVAYPLRMQEGARLVFPRAVHTAGPRDLYAIELQASGRWTQPASLGPVINSAYDEPFGLYVPATGYLFFSSAGHYGMGGLDIFFSRYDGRTKQWSAPENLGYPYNSPSDEYLLAYDYPSPGRIVVASTRGHGCDSLTLYELSYSPQALGQAVYDVDQLYANSFFPAQASGGARRVAAPRSPEVPKPEGNSTLRDVEQDAEYQRALRAGFRQQRLADSLRTLLERYREQLWDVETVAQRKALEAKIAPVEDGMLAAQREADRHFVVASQVEREYITGRRRPKGDTKAGKGFANDNPEALYMAQLAPTVFQPDELKALAKVTKTRAQGETFCQALQLELRRLARRFADTAERTEALAQAEAELEIQLQAYLDMQGERETECRQIYQSCLPVALIKSGRQAAPQVKACERKAGEQFRAAQALLSNAMPGSRGQSAFQALLFQRLGNDYLELGYSYAWGMVAYRQRVQRRADSLAAYLMPTQQAEQSAALPALQQEGAGGTAPLEVLPERGLVREATSRYTQANPVPVDGPLPSGVVYKLQLGAYSNPIDPALFKGMYPMSAAVTQEGKITKYYAGYFLRYADAVAGKSIADACGFPEAFLVAWYDGREVPLARARSLEGTQGSTAQKARGQFVVNLGVFAEPQLSAELQTTIRLLAPGKQLVCLPLDDGRYSYRLSLFTERGQAQHVCDNLQGSGLVSAQVEALP